MPARYSSRIYGSLAPVTSSHPRALPSTPEAVLQERARQIDIRLQAARSGAALVADRIRLIEADITRLHLQSARQLRLSPAASGIDIQDDLLRLDARHLARLLRVHQERMNDLVTEYKTAQRWIRDMEEQLRMAQRELARRSSDLRR